MASQEPERIEIPVLSANTVIVGAGAAGLNCAVHLHEFMREKGIKNPGERIVVVGARAGEGTQTRRTDAGLYYKLGTNPASADCAVDLAGTLTESGCAHGDIALAEAESSLREFYHLVSLGVPFPHDPEGAYVGGADALGRASSAGPDTWELARERLREQCNHCKIEIHDQHQVARLLTEDTGDGPRIAGVLTFDRLRTGDETFGITVFLCENLVLAAEEPEELYGAALGVGLKAHNFARDSRGLVVDKWWQSSIAHTFACGEMAGTHGASCPDGAALNACQVGGLRAAEYIAKVYGTKMASVEVTGPISAQIRAQYLRCAQLTAGSEGISLNDAIARLGTPAAVCDLDAAKAAADEARALFKKFRAGEVKLDAPSDIMNAVRAEHLALARVACMEAIVESFQARKDDLIAEVALDSLDDCIFTFERVPVRPIPTRADSLDTVQTDFKTGAVYRK